MQYAGQGHGHQWKRLRQQQGLVQAAAGHRAGDSDRGRPPPTQTRQGAGRAPGPQSVPAQHTQPLGGRWGSGRTSRGSSTSSTGDFDDLIITAPTTVQARTGGMAVTTQVTTSGSHELPPGNAPGGTLPPGAPAPGDPLIGAPLTGAPATGALTLPHNLSATYPAPQTTGPSTGTNTAATTSGGEVGTAKAPAPMHPGQRPDLSKAPQPELTPGAERHKARQKLDKAARTSGLNLNPLFNNAVAEDSEPGATQADNNKDLNEETVEEDMEEMLPAEGDPGEKGGPQDMGSGAMLMD
ncbi:hypothetical protein V8C86DRAFT_2950172 [Haematococcus lacustris]